MTKLARSELAQVDAPSQLFKQVVDRNDLDWSSWLFSSAPAALVASEQLVRQATDNRPAAAGPQRRWRKNGLQAGLGKNRTTRSAFSRSESGGLSDAFLIRVKLSCNR